MSKSTLYEILGVSQDAKEDEIKKAYRSLSFKYHPDRNNEDNALDKMKEINEAYEILREANERKKYDNKLKYGDIEEMELDGAFHNMDGDMNEIFKMFSNLGSGFGFGGANIRVFHSGGFGGGGGGFSHMFHQQPEPLNKKVTISLLQAFQGCSIQVEIERSIISSHNRLVKTEKETIGLNIPQGIDNTEMLVIKDKGNSVTLPNGIEQLGELHISFEITNDTIFKRNEMDLNLYKKITLKDALCGFSFEIHHINGKRFNICNMNNIIYPGFKKIVPNLGMTRNNITGNLVIHFEIEFPLQLSQTQLDELNKIL